MNLKRITIGLTVIASLAFGALVFAGSPDPGSGAVNFTVMNTETSGDATVNASYVNQSGAVVSTIPQTIAQQSSQGFPITSSNVPAGFVGSAVISSDKEIVAFAQMIWSGGAFGDGRQPGSGAAAWTSPTETACTQMERSRSGKPKPKRCPSRSK